MQNIRSEIFEALNKYISRIDYDTEEEYYDLVNKLVSVNEELGSEIYKLCDEQKDNCYAMNIIGILYNNGIGRVKDIDLAFNYFIKAANLGSRDSMVECAEILVKQRKYEMAFYWFERAADLGSRDSMNELGCAYSVLGNREKTIYWYEKASNLGCTHSMWQLALYLVNINKTKALEWFTKAYVAYVDDSSKTECLDYIKLLGGDVEAVQLLTKCFVI